MAKKKLIRQPVPLTSSERKTLSTILGKARAFKAFKNAQEEAATPAPKPRQKK